MEAANKGAASVEGARNIGMGESCISLATLSHRILIAFPSHSFRILIAFLSLIHCLHIAFLSPSPLDRFPIVFQLLSIAQH
jgi:hypothetical protein